MNDPAPPTGWFNRTVIGAGLTSLLADVSYEMATAVLPGFFQLLAIPGYFLGLTEGTGDALANFVKLPEMRRCVQAQYEEVSVDVGRFNRNLHIPARFGVTKKLEGVPALLIVTPEGKLVNGANIFATADARHMTPQALADYLARYAD